VRPSAGKFSIPRGRENAENYTNMVIMGGLPKMLHIVDANAKV
jgi:hypothetical protein